MMKIIAILGILALFAIAALADDAHTAPTPTAGPATISLAIDGYAAMTFSGDMHIHLSPDELGPVGGTSNTLPLHAVANFAYQVTALLTKPVGVAGSWTLNCPNAQLSGWWDHATYQKASGVSLDENLSVTVSGITLANQTWGNYNDGRVTVTFAP
jgi:hypothetical protein